MKSINYNNSKDSLVLFELGEKLEFLVKLYESNKFPKVLMVTGKKGIGKSTLINHFLTHVYDKGNYDLKNKSINSNSKFYKSYTNNIFPNIIYLSGNDFKSIKTDDVRDLKSKILKSTISSSDRFIILDDVELFNRNSLNALLKIIEEPTSKNFFVLINNKSKPLIETIYSRCLEIKIFLNDDTRIKIIESLIERENLEIFIDFRLLHLTPGNFLLFNRICKENTINFDGNFLKNLEILINLFKKDKNIVIINMILFLTDYYFYNLRNENKDKIEKIIEKKNFVTKNINKFFSYNLNHTSLINAINNKLLNG